MPVPSDDGTLRPNDAVNAAEPSAPVSEVEPVQYGEKDGCGSVMVVVLLLFFLAAVIWASISAVVGGDPWSAAAAVVAAAMLRVEWSWLAVRSPSCLSFDGERLSWRTPLFHRDVPVTGVKAIRTSKTLSSVQHVELTDAPTLWVAAGAGFGEFAACIQDVRPDLPVELCKRSTRQPSRSNPNQFFGRRPTRPGLEDLGDPGGSEP